MLTTDVCGYAHYITDAKAGHVVPSPFSQDKLNQLTADMLASEQRYQWQANAIKFSQQEDLYSMPERAAELIIERAEKRKQGLSSC